MREESDKKVFAEKGHPIIIEGIHSLNEKLTSSIKREDKYKIYISALTQIAIDDHNRLHTTDTRLIRRIVRDSQFRSQDALSTLKRWSSVRRGEEKNIFPFQEDADMMFNSALIYELSILKKYAYPLLKIISPEDKEYYVAKRLLDLLEYVPEITDKYVPLNSILREFIGGSSIHGK
jgi:uridine kinase